MLLGCPAGGLVVVVVVGGSWKMLFSCVKEAGNGREGEMDTDCARIGARERVMNRRVEQAVIVERCLGQ